MTLEAAIAELNTNLKLNTEAMLKVGEETRRLADLRANAIETVKEAVEKPAEAPKATRTRKAAEPAAEEKQPDPAPETRQITQNPDDRREVAVDTPLKTAIATYVGTGYPENHPQAKEERAARAAKVRTLFAKVGEKLGAEINTQADIPEKHHATVIKKLEEFAAEGNLVIKADAPASDDLDL